YFFCIFLNTKTFMVHSCFFSPDGHFITILDLCYYRGEDPHDVEDIWRAISDMIYWLHWTCPYLSIGKTTSSRKQKNSVLLYYFPLSVEPSVHLSMTPHGDRHPSMLTCSAYKFYPKQIRVTWLRNGQEVPSNMTSSEELANGDWHYQIHSYLEYTPTPGEKISCMVEHTSFTEPKILHWDMSLPESERSKIAIGIYLSPMIVLLSL
uniref:Ig-like domain-containing protein n=1 Tax=Oncorhynchus kisutch TaxID=8019 RepID=A0A8C7N8P1_ONCKI